MLLLSIPFHKKVKKNPEMTTEPFLLTRQRVCTCLLTLSFRTTRIGRLSDYCTFNHCLCSSCCFLRQKSNLFRFCIKSHVKAASFLPSKYLSFCCCSAKQYNACSKGYLIYTFFQKCFYYPSVFNRKLKRIQK